MRRKSQLLAFRPDLEITPLRGNVETRVRKLKEQDLDAVILAYAGVKRMGLEQRVREVLSLDVMIPACGQGAIGIETRSGSDAALLVEPLNHEATRFEVSIERTFQAGVGGGCSVPLGINARLSGGRVTLRAAYGDETGAIIFKDRLEGERAEGAALMEGLLDGLKRARAAALSH